jgi:hypothetical protein
MSIVAKNIQLTIITLGSFFFNVHFKDAEIQINKNRTLRLNEKTKKKS